MTDVMAACTEVGVPMSWGVRALTSRELRRTVVEEGRRSMHFPGRRERPLEVNETIEEVNRLEHPVSPLADVDLTDHANLDEPPSAWVRNCIAVIR